MTPKEKALEIYFKYNFVMSEIQLAYGFMLMVDVISTNKKLAQIEIDAIMKEINPKKIKKLEYLKKVKQEILKL